MIDSQNMLTALQSSFAATPTDEQAERAEARSASICQENPLADTDAASNEACRITSSNASHKSKYNACVTLVNNVTATINKYSPCMIGCSHCCNISVIISRHEAEAISAKTGKKIYELQNRNPDSLKHLSDKFKGLPCPFLAGGECSIYDVRPMACRAHHTLNDDAGQCDLSVPSKQSCVSSLASPYIIHQFITLDALHRNMAHGDIREFFIAGESEV